MTAGGRYVLLTAAKNEDRYIGTAIESVLRQRLRPLAWFIMDDGSVDRTAEIVAGYAARHPFIRLHIARSGGERSFGAQYRAINAAYALLNSEHLDFDFVGVQDADIAPVADDYYERLFQMFDADPGLGIAGGAVLERSGEQWLPRPSNAVHSVAGGVQMFRRACLDDIGGYTPLRFGGEDWLVQIDAQAVGWSVMTFADLGVQHHRPTSSAQGRLRGLLRLGMRDASFGSHFAFEFLKCARRIGEPPRLLGSCLRLGGYLWYSLRMRQPLLPPEKVAWLRHEQAQRVRKAWGIRGDGAVSPEGRQ